jgi:hypothetical protein
MTIRGVLGTTVVAALLALPVLAAAECNTEFERDDVTVETCPIEGTGYSLVRNRTTAPGTVGAVVDLLLTEEERGTGGAPADRSVLEAATGEGLRLRVSVTRRSWWRLDDGGVVLDVVGDDDRPTDLEGTRLLCLRSRWTIVPDDAAGMVTILQDFVSDTRPPLGMKRRATQATVQNRHRAIVDLRQRLAGAQDGEPDLTDWPLLEAALPDLPESFASCYGGG